MCVSVVLFYNDRFLMLKRNNPPVNWCPPCGRVENGESFVEAAIREVFEETSIKIKTPILVDVWHNNSDTVSVTFLTSTTNSEVILSDEHSDYKWLTDSELKFIDTDFDTSKFKQYANSFDHTF